MSEHELWHSLAERALTKVLEESARVVAAWREATAQEQADLHRYEGRVFADAGTPYAKVFVRVRYSAEDLYDGRFAGVAVMDHAPQRKDYYSDDEWMEDKKFVKKYGNERIYSASTKRGHELDLVTCYEPYTDWGKAGYDVDMALRNQGDILLGKETLTMLIHRLYGTLHLCGEPEKGE